MSFNINLEVLYIDKAAARCVCFKHAVQLAMDGTVIKPEVYEIGNEYDMRNLSCYVCEAEEIKEEQKSDG